MTTVHSLTRVISDVESRGGEYERQRLAWKRGGLCWREPGALLSGYTTFISTTPSFLVAIYKCSNDSTFTTTFNDIGVYALEGPAIRHAWQMDMNDDL